MVHLPSALLADEMDTVKAEQYERLLVNLTQL